MSELTRAQSAVFVFVAKLLKLDNQVSIESYGFDPDGSEFYHAAYSRMPLEWPGVFAIVTLPKNSDKVFIAISDGDPSEVAKNLLGLQHYDEHVERICCGDTVPLSADPIVQRCGWSAAFVTAAAFLLTDFPDSASIHGKEYFFNLVVFISERERAVKIHGGIDALLDLFEEENRDIVAFDQRGSKIDL